MVSSKDADVQLLTPEVQLDVNPTLVCKEISDSVSCIKARSKTLPVYCEEWEIDVWASPSTSPPVLSPVLMIGENSFHLSSPDWVVALAMMWCKWFVPAAPFVSGEASNPGPSQPSSSVQQPRSMAAQPKKKKRKNRKKKGGNSLDVTQNSIPANRLSSVPSAIGYVANQNTFSISQNVQRNADQDSKNGVRCAGSALLNQAVSTYSASYGTGGSAYPSGYTGALALSSASGHGYWFLAPNEVDPRLSALVSCYQYYAFRRLCLKYIPAIPTTQAGTIFLSISKDPEEAITLYANVGGVSSGLTAGTIQDVMDTDPAVASTAWQPALVEFIHRGTKLWETFSNSEEPVVARLQAAIVCLFQGAPPTAVSTLFQFGNLYLEYEIDLYVPGPPLASN